MDNVITQPDFISFLAGTKEAEYQNLFTFAVDSLTFANKVHIYHWSCDSGFAHTHLQEIYETIRDFADKLVETALGDDVKFKINSKNYLISDEIYQQDAAIRKIQFYIDELSKLSDQYAENKALANLIDDTIEKLTSELGLLKNFH